jgi:hypothetical protein
MFASHYLLIFNSIGDFMPNYTPLARIKNNIAFARQLVETGDTPEVIGTVSGSESARVFWQSILDRACTTLKARAGVSFHEDLPVNQAFGILLLWQRLRDHITDDRGSLVAFVFGEGTRATPFTETDNAQKPAIATYVATPTADGHRYLSMVELAMYYRVPVQQYLRRSGFHGLVIQWGDEVQIPSCDLSAIDTTLDTADIVRFVSIRRMTTEQASEKDWVGVDADGRVTAFIPRRPLAEMAALADRGLLQRRGDDLYGGINLGSIAVSYALLDALLAEFTTEVNDANANRKQRPDLDPQFFTALCIAVIDNDDKRGAAWQTARDENEAMAKLHDNMPDIMPRLRRVLEQFEATNGRKLKMQAMDFGEPFWGDIGQHPQIYKFYTSLNKDSDEGEISRAIAGLEGIERDASGNLIVNSDVGAGITVTNSVLINATLTGAGTITNSVMIGTRARDITADSAFDVCSTVDDLRLAPRSGTYKVVSSAPVHAGAGERYTTLFMPTRGTQLIRVDEDTNLRDRAGAYDAVILGNAVSFNDAHIEMGNIGIDELAAARAAAERDV